MDYQILFRTDSQNEEEFNACCDKIDETKISLSRSSIGYNKTVIGRYSVLPYYKELEEDLKFTESNLINSYREHLYIANFEYYEDVKKFTPKTYFALHNVPNEGKFVVKGVTNSRKFDWNTMMFADGKKEAIDIALKLSKDGLIGQQDIIVRDYVPLKTFEVGLNGLPFTNEWRFFFLGKNLVDYGFYWTIADNVNHFFPKDKLPFVQEIADIVSEKTNFFVLDVAQTESGEWILIEINDAQMSGLSCIDPHRFYKKLKLELEK